MTSPRLPATAVVIGRDEPRGGISGQRLEDVEAVRAGVARRRALRRRSSAPHPGSCSMADFLSWLGDHSLLWWIGLIVGALGAAAAVLPGELRKVRDKQQRGQRP